MWRDLDWTAWPDASGLLNNILVARLLGEDPTGEPDAPLASDDEPIDGHVDLAAAIHVLNADSSQALCIEEARRSRNLVIQGPPGTGKSQTIANIIAAAAHDGKSVLFVAEKAAALEVVYNRLKAVGLDPLCLEIHSKKATKPSVIGSLERAIRAGSAAQVDGRTADQLRSARDRLNEWSAALHREIRRSGRTPYQVMGTVLRLHAERTRVLGQRLDVAINWDRDRLQEAERAVERASIAVAKLGTPPIGHPWCGALGGRLTPFDADRLKEVLSEVRKRTDDLGMLDREAAALLCIEPDSSCTILRDVVKSLQLLARVPDGRDVLGNFAWRSERRRIAQLAHNGMLWSSRNSELSGCVIEAAFTFDVRPVRHTIAAHGTSIVRCFIASYRQAIADLRGICRGQPPKRLQDRLLLLDHLVAAQSAQRGLEEERDFGRLALGSIWKSEGTSWATVEAMLQWADEAEHAMSRADLFVLASSVAPDACISLANRLETAIAAFCGGFAKVADIVRLDPAEAFVVSDVELVPLSSISERLSKWAQTIPEFNDWVSTRESLDALRRWELEQIADGLRDGSIGVTEAKPMTDLLIAEALWACAREDDSTIDQIDGIERSETVVRFRALDRRRIELARSEVLARYFDQRPNGHSGEMGIVRAEIAKKRRHLPIRKLMEQAGSAVQRLKPVFLMSPLSVAQFLPAGRLTFDLVVIDEASQVPPEEAIGTIARARQMVVVGDDKQLPPTNFFRMVAADDGEEDDYGDGATPPARTGDFESILTLARARGVPERMLRWHYRSRHSSLIALSNHVCYGGGLLMPPSPLVKADHLGLSLVKTPRGHYDRGGSGRNSVEADLIATAVENHLLKRANRSLGIACFSVAQRDAIEDALQSRGILSAAEAFAPNGERLFVKNLEAVQGDERDIIFISIGYGPDAQGRMTAGFGPLSSDGGERRLNVLISRAREQCVVFSSITAGDIPADAKPR